MNVVMVSIYYASSQGNKTKDVNHNRDYDRNHPWKKLVTSWGRLRNKPKEDELEYAQ